MLANQIQNPNPNLFKPISRPTLPAVQGYVEVDYDNQRVYKEVSTGKLYYSIPSYNPTNEQQQIADNDLEILLMKQELGNKQNLI